MNCKNCSMEITGTTCADVNKQPLCFECWFTSQSSPDGTIYCPKCFGMGTVKVSLCGDRETCQVCKGTKRIGAATVEPIKPVPLPKITKWKTVKIPF